MAKYQLHRVTNRTGAVVELNCTRAAALRFAPFGAVLVSAWDDTTDRRCWLPVVK